MKTIKLICKIVLVIVACVLLYMLFLIGRNIYENKISYLIKIRKMEARNNVLFKKHFVKIKRIMKEYSMFPIYVDDIEYIGKLYVGKDGSASYKFPAIFYADNIPNKYEMALLTINKENSIYKCYKEKPTEDKYSEIKLVNGCYVRLEKIIPNTPRTLDLATIYMQRYFGFDQQHVNESYNNSVNNSVDFVFKEIDYNTGERYLQKGYIKEHVKGELVHALILQPGESIYGYPYQSKGDGEVDCLKVCGIMDIDSLWNISSLPEDKEAFGTKYADN